MRSDSTKKVSEISSPLIKRVREKPSFEDREKTPRVPLATTTSRTCGELTQRGTRCPAEKGRRTGVPMCALSRGVPLLTAIVATALTAGAERWPGGRGPIASGFAAAAAAVSEECKEKYSGYNCSYCATKCNIPLPQWSSTSKWPPGGGGGGASTSKGPGIDYVTPRPPGQPVTPSAETTRPWQTGTYPAKGRAQMQPIGSGGGMDPATESIRPAADAHDWPDWPGWYGVDTVRGGDSRPGTDGLNVDVGMVVQVNHDASKRSASADGEGRRPRLAHGADSRQSSGKWRRKKSVAENQKEEEKPSCSTTTDCRDFSLYHLIIPMQTGRVPEAWSINGLYTYRSTLFVFGFVTGGSVGGRMAPKGGDRGLKTGFLLGLNHWTGERVRVNNDDPVTMISRPGFEYQLLDMVVYRRGVPWVLVHEKETETGAGRGLLMPVNLIGQSCHVAPTARRCDDVISTMLPPRTTIVALCVSTSSNSNSPGFHRNSKSHTYDVFMRIATQIADGRQKNSIKMFGNGLKEYEWDYGVSKGPSGGRRSCGVDAYGHVWFLLPCLSDPGKVIQVVVDPKTMTEGRMVSNIKNAGIYGTGFLWFYSDHSSLPANWIYALYEGAGKVTHISKIPVITGSRTTGGSSVHFGRSIWTVEKPFTLADKNTLLEPLTGRELLRRGRLGNISLMTVTPEGLVYVIDESTGETDRNFKLNLSVTVDRWAHLSVSKDGHHLAIGGIVPGKGYVVQGIHVFQNLAWNEDWS